MIALFFSFLLQLLFSHFLKILFVFVFVFVFLQLGSLSSGDVRARNQGVYRPPICWSSAGSVLACASGATGSVVLWGVDKDAGSTNSSVAVNTEASASGGHWSSVTTLAISSDTLLSGSEDGMVLLWFLCRVPRTKLPAVSSRPYHLLRGHRNPVLLSSMSHAVGVAVTSSSTSELLFHRLPRPPPLGPGFQPSTEYPHTVIDLSTYPPFATSAAVTVVAAAVAGVLDVRQYVVTLCSICSTGEIVVHCHHVQYKKKKSGAEQLAAMDTDLLGLDFSTTTTSSSTTSSSSSPSESQEENNSPPFVLLSFNVNGVLNSTWIGPTKNDVNPNLLCDAPLLSMEPSRRSSIVLGGTSSGQVLIWHARDLVLLSWYSTGGFAVHSMSLCPSEEFVAVGCDAGVMVTIALPNCRDGADPSVSTSTGGISGRVESVRKKVGGAAIAVGKTAGAVGGMALNAGKKLFGGLWGKKS